MGVVSDGLMWPGSYAMLSLYAVFAGSSTFDPKAIPLEPQPRKVSSFELEDETGALPGRRVFVYDFVYPQVPEPLAHVLEACLTAARNAGAEVAWFAFEAAFHFEDVLTASVANQVYAVVDSEGVAIATDTTLLSAEWAEHLARVRERVWGTSPPRS